jgi:hypothetical protein
MWSADLRQISLSQIVHPWLTGIAGCMESQGGLLSLESQQLRWGPWNRRFRRYDAGAKLESKGIIWIPAGPSGICRSFRGEETHPQENAFDDGGVCSSRSPSFGRDRHSWGQTGFGILSMETLSGSSKDL